ncbi:Uncharacterized protein APZ42_017771 [Daphnia magna]|uniref:DUF5641 domain-containing protein n=1 Tax=Daphnia magna TaxID=35525 RepID=A0A162CJC5_9CRUS|nr:Uncharacterized protein APZ42_017771 [Daphnia magna]
MWCATLTELDKTRRKYVNDLCSRFAEDYLRQLANFNAKEKCGKKIRLGDVVVIHDDNTKRLMWKVGVVKELIPSKEGLIRSVILKTPHGNLINRAIQSFHPLELREDQDEDLETAGQEL